ncbi:hypothetical protein [Nonlabens sp.]|uniref:hypothetical protein n=1 Tax=Nonlabens sp. TaxID=1888209 RepID=UPI003F69D3CF
MSEFGRELAYKLYDSEGYNLEQELDDELKNYLITFADVFDLSYVSMHTVREVLEVIKTN